MTIRKKVDDGARKTVVPSADTNLQTTNKSSLSINAAVEGGERVDQIREILFGAQRQEYERRLTQLEELLVKDISRDTERKIDSHTTDNERKFKQLEQRFDEAISELKKETARQFNQQKNEYNQIFNSLEERLPKIIADFNKRIDAEVASLSKHIDTLKSEVARNLEQIDRHKMDRVSLAKFLHNAATGIEGKETKADAGS
jgi:exonuclease VII large subunit